MSFNRQAARAARASQETGHTFEPKYPDGTGIGATITVRGPDSASVRELLKRQLTRLQAKELAAKRRGNEIEPPNLDELEQQAVDLAVAYTVTWGGFFDGDIVLEPTEQNLRAIYAECSWIRRQVIEEAQELGNFVRPPSASSSPTLPPSSAST